ncbi:hypothetical protein CA831_04735 [Burkholderia multivorans]|uniref:Uncharacterized protein n=1 Tax=Burkholderia multivorans CGD2 TaxID=513052 RepID=B9BK51_9BURK|nr:hypothetical protein BURMUCGD1_5022 [Burkholderia multivorans CGD1]EEE08318.1 hypothetical protein BURMUCGD2_5459 [Burkholderia multivorans CGD2]EEE16005.1 hypothetical protein BURMUCGD2M_5450 [Burkholderia multivorans CGD2M]EJO57327.1 hypothetical protein BURMUCF2_A1445 [Burkholderia multivorans CF2]EJO61825.1 hypothetical protein BURMUCF1_A1424 [Burkholderia multivorans ATCC BAA-247]OXH91888.1 hypothetical protein CA831_04735 [Burkholderia multivorans]
MSSTYCRFVRRGSRVPCAFRTCPLRRRLGRPGVGSGGSPCSGCRRRRSLSSAGRGFLSCRG